MQIQKAKSQQESRILEYKTQLKEKAKRFHVHLEISDEITFDNIPWNVLKRDVLKSEEYKTKQWYVNLTDSE